MKGERPADVFASLRAAGSGLPPDSGIARPSAMRTKPRFTIADMGGFAEETYAARLDEWCTATLEAWGASKSA